MLDIYKCIMANTSATWQQAAHTTYQLSSPSCSTQAIQKSQTRNKKILRVFWKKSQENGPLAEKWQDRKSKRTRQKKTRQEIGKGNQMTALRFQTGGWYQTFLASLWGACTGDMSTYNHSSTNNKKNKWLLMVFTSGKQNFVKILLWH